VRGVKVGDDVREEMLFENHVRFSDFGFYIEGKLVAINKFKQRCSKMQSLLDVVLLGY
jgi:hypothetical protein